MPIAACEQAALSKSEENGQEEAALTILPPKSFLPTLPPIKINPASRDHEWLTFFVWAKLSTTPAHCLPNKRYAQYFNPMTVKRDLLVNCVVI